MAVRTNLQYMTETKTTEQLWGAETNKAVANSPVSGEPIPVHVARWLGRIKAAAARVNAELGLLDAEKAERIAAAADRIASGELDDQFPIDVFQTGSGTSSNMNANEVIATLAGDDVHANDDVNMGQSSNDVFPSAVHLAALDRIVNDLLPALDRLAGSLAAKAAEFDDVVKSGRTHWMDAVPVTLGQEFGGYSAQVREGKARVESSLGRLGKIPLGGTAVGTGLNTHPEFAERVRARLAADSGLAAARREVRRRHRSQPRAVRAVRRVDAVRGGRAQSVHRLRQGGRDRQEGVVVGPLSARGSPRGRRRRRCARRGPRLPRDGEATRLAAKDPSDEA